MVPNQWFNYLVAAVLWLGMSVAVAATYTLPADFARFNNDTADGECSLSGSTITCSDDLKLDKNDVLIVSQPMTIIVDGDVEIGDNAEVNTGQAASWLTIEATGDFDAKKNSTLNANIVVDEDVEIGDNVVMTGDIEAVGKVEVKKNAVVNGNISSEDEVKIEKNATVNGDVNAPNVDNSGAINGQQCDINNNKGACSAAGGGPAGIGHWAMDEAGWTGAVGEVLDSSGNDYHGQAQNGASTLLSSPARPGDPGTCGFGNFDGTNHFSVPNNSALNNLSSFTVAFWVRADAANQDNSSFTYQTLVVYGDGPTLGNSGKFELYRLASSGVLRLEIRTRNNQSRFVEINGNQVFDGNWHHIAATFDRSQSELTIVLDGDYAQRTRATFNGNRDLNNVTGDLHVGSQSFNSNGIIGNLDELFIGNRVLTEAEITELYELTRPCPNILPAPVLSYQMNAGPWNDGVAGEVKDSSGNNLDGMAVGGVNWFTGDDDPALVTDGAGLGSCGYGEFDTLQSQYIQTNHDPLLNQAGDFTLGLWVKPDSSVRFFGVRAILGKGFNYKLMYTFAGQLLFLWRDTSGQVRVAVAPANTLVSDQWSYVAMRYTAGEQTLFVDGVAVATTNFPFYAETNTAPLTIGQEVDIATTYFNGALDQFEIFNSALNDAQVQALQEQRFLCAGAPLQCYNDTFDDGSIFGTTWDASSTSGTFTPGVVNGRVRLTENSPNQATRVTLNEIFPAANNRVIVEFDLYGYGGSGADGIALVFSDASVPAQAGGYGGSLGYAQTTNGGGAPGFAGGWLGIGFDEYGNFSRNNEGRVGGYTDGQLRPDHVVLRGAEANGYPYLKDSGLLVPGVDQLGPSPGPGHKYRIIIDSTTAGTSLISVERDIGAGYQFIIAPFDVFADFPGQQPLVPENFQISFTGSTGGSTNIHEFDDIQVCALQTGPGTPQITHFRLTHQGESIACLATPIQVEACLDSNCNSKYAGPIDVQLSASQGDYSGGNTLSYSGASGTAYLRNTNGGNAQIGVVTSNPVPQAGFTTDCFIGSIAASCDINFKNAGLIITDTDGVSPLPNQIAGVDFSGLIRAVETNTTTGACEARVSGNQSVDLGFQCRNPQSCIAGQEFTVNGTPVAANNDGVTTNRTAVPLNFDAAGSAAVDFNYTDVGQVQILGTLDLNEDIPDPAYTLTGNSADFVVKPHTIAISDASAASGSNPGTTNSGIGFAAAGETFTVAVAAQNALGAATPNFGNEITPEKLTVALDSLVYPSGGVLGNLSVAGDFTAVATTPGHFYNSSVSYDEAGSIRLTGALDDNDYLGAGDVLNKPQSPITGRFYPESFTLASNFLTNSCGAFSYMDQPAIQLSYQVLAVGLGGNTLQNYDSSGYENTAEFELVARTDSDLGLGPRFTALPIGWSGGVQNISVSDIAFARAATPDGPFAPMLVGLRIGSELDSRNFSGLDFNELDATCSGAGCDAIELSGTLDMRYGRLVLDNTFGPEDINLPVPLRSEYWDGSGFVFNSDDSCTAINPAQLAIVTHPDNDPLLTVANGAITNLSSGETLDSDLYWEPPTNADPEDRVGEFLYEYQAPPWLQFDWTDEDGNSYTHPRATAGFGQFRGNDRVIYQRELGW